jgi:transposase
MASTSGKRCTLSIEKKMEILEALISKKSDEVDKDFNIGYSTVKRIRQNEEEAGIVDELMRRVSHKDSLMHLSIVRKYLEENYTEYNSYYDIEDMIEKNAFINHTQSKITDFFK